MAILKTVISKTTDNRK